MNPGRGERIRTSGLYVPNVALYQAKLHPEKLAILAKRPVYELLSGLRLREDRGDAQRTGRNPSATRGQAQPGPWAQENQGR